MNTTLHAPMHRRRFITLGLSALGGLMLPGTVFGRQFVPEHLVYQIGVRKGWLGRGNITGHLQLDLAASRYRITIWAEAITKKVLIITLGRETEDEAMNLLLDPEHINPLRVRCTAFGRIVGGKLHADGVVVTDKKDGRELSRLDIRDASDGGAVATYTFMDHEPVTEHFSRRPSEPLTALVSIARGSQSVFTISLSSGEGRPLLTGRMLTASDSCDSYTQLQTGPDAKGRFWDFKSDAYAAIEDDRIVHLRIDRYNVFKSIDVRCEGTKPLQDIGHG